MTSIPVIRAQKLKKCYLTSFFSVLKEEDFSSTLAFYAEYCISDELSYGPIESICIGGVIIELAKTILVGFSLTKKIQKAITKKKGLLLSDLPDNTPSFPLLNKLRRFISIANSIRKNNCRR